LRSARARRVERFVVSFDGVDELFMLLSVALLVEPFVPLLIPVELLVLPDDVPLFMVDERLVPVAVPLERVVLLLFIELPLFIDPLVVLLMPELGAVLCALLLGEPDAPPWPPLDEPFCARALPHAMAAAAERARILRVCLMGYS
jgi:hypothetical protein